jgi:hypothetical protein
MIQSSPVKTFSTGCSDYIHRFHEKDAPHKIRGSRERSFLLTRGNKNHKPIFLLVPKTVRLLLHFILAHSYENVQTVNKKNVLLFFPQTGNFVTIGLLVHALKCGPFLPSNVGLAHFW